MKLVTCVRTLGGRKSPHFLPMKGSSMTDFRCAMLLQTCTGGKLSFCLNKGRNFGRGGGGIREDDV